MAVVMGMALFTVVVSTATATETPSASWADDIGTMIEAGDYVEGQAIAAFRTTEDGITVQSAAPYGVKPIMEVGASAVRGAADGDDVVRAQATEGVTLSLVSSDALSTEELLLALADDPNVAFAEPNYVEQVDFDAASESGVQALATATAADLAADTDLIDDLTPLQWNFWAGPQVSHTVNTAENLSINVPAFGSAEKGANMEKEVVVALIDMPADYTNPDLASVVYHFSPEQQQALGCWEWGYNAVGGGINGNVLDQAALDFGHGTHTAGIIGAAWDGHGLSGVASNVKIVSIQLPNSDGMESLADSLDAMAFIDRFNQQAPEDERIKVANNSWSKHFVTRALDAALRELGDTWGVVSVFSAGNDAKDNDYYQKFPSAFMDNPYVIVVANTTMEGKLSDSSEYGEATVDLAAPGDVILSTLPKPSSRYYADGSRSTNLAYYGFDGDEDASLTVTQLDATDVDNTYHHPVGEPVEVGEVGTVVSSAHFFGDRSLKIDLDPAYSTQLDYGDLSFGYYLLRFNFDIPSSEVAARIQEDGRVMFGVASAADGTGSVFPGYISTNATTGYFADESFTASNDVSWRTDSIAITAEGETSPSYMAVGTDDPASGEDVGADAEDEVEAAAETDKFSITMAVVITNGGSTLYLDSIGVGTRVFPYDFKSGTSMAAPAVAGAAAVLASQGYEGAELASLVRSKVRIPEGGALPVRTGGLFDFNVAGSPDDGGAESLAPGIAQLSLDGTTLTITGSNFGLAPGTVDVSRYIVGTDLSPVAASIASWADDKIVLTLDSPFTGIMQVVVTNAAGKYDTSTHMFSKGENVYEQDLPFEVSTGDLTSYDESGDYETMGPLVGLGCKLYYLPGCAYDHEDSDSAYRLLRCFDLQDPDMDRPAQSARVATRRLGGHL